MKHFSTYIPLFFLLLSSNSYTADLTDKGNYYFFGDSAMGQGNYSAIVEEVGEDHFPYSSNNGHARDSNGLIWVEMLGREVDIIFDENRTANNINFAISGARMTRLGDEDLNDLGIETGVLRQTEYFEKQVSDGNLSVSSDDVFFIQAGGNDLLDRLESEDSDIIISDIAQAAAKNISTLVAVGAKTIVLAEVESIDFSPQFSDTPNLKAQLANIMVQTNKKMFEAVTALNLADDVNLVTMKHTDFLSYITTSGNKLGFDNIDSVCYDDDAETLCSIDKTEQNRYIFFDDVHLTEAAHRIEAQWFSATLASADGSASRQTSRIPDVFQYELESSFLSQKQISSQRGEQPYTLFFDLINDHSTLKKHTNDPRANMNLKGAVIGAEAKIMDNAYIGGSFRFTDSRTKFSEDGKFEGDTKAIYGWAGYDFSHARLGVSGAYGWIDIDSIDRLTGVDLLTTTGKTNGHFHDVAVEISSALETKYAVIDMAISAHTSQIKIDDYIESGANGLNLSYGQQTLKSNRIQLDLKAKGLALDLGYGVYLTPIVEASYRHEFERDGHKLTSRLFNNTANAATIKTGGPASNRINAGIGFDINFSRVSIGIRYQKSWGDDLSDSDTGSLSILFK